MAEYSKLTLEENEALPVLLKSFSSYITRQNGVPYEILKILYSREPVELATFEKLDELYGRIFDSSEIIMVARIFAAILAQLKIYWDDELLSEFERLEITGKTTSGLAFYDFGCFASQPENTSAFEVKPADPDTPPVVTKAQKTPMSGYKSSGPQSGNIINLVGQPNSKVKPTGTVFCIEADKLGKNVPNIFIKPLDSKYNTNNGAKVLMGSGNGYTDCKCWFRTLQEANDFLNTIVNNTNLVNKYTNVKVKKARPDSNGYFEVKTEFGNCLIKASKMNEELAEDLITLDNVEAFADALMRE